MKLYDVIRKEYPETPHAEHEERLGVYKKPRSFRHHFSIRKKIIFFGVVLIALAFIYAAGNRYVRARVTIKEREIPFLFENTSLTIPHETKELTGRVSFQTMKISTEITREIYGSEFKEVTGRAKGSVIFLNEFSTTTQTIKSGTRIVADNGKTYTTGATVTVPGYKTDNKKKVPGASTPVSITATDVGPSFNSPGTTFSVSSFSGTKRKQLYGRSSSPLTGGEAGTMHTVADGDRDAVIESLKTQLSERLRRETRAQIPPTHITYPELQLIFIDTDSLKLSGEGIKFPVTIKGTMVSYLLPKDLFQQSLAAVALSSESYQQITIPELQNLSVVPTSPLPASTETIPDTITVSVSGQAKIIPQISPAKVQGLLVGTKRTQFTRIMEGVPEVDTAQFSLYPFWALYFPKDESHIGVDYR